MRSRAWLAALVFATCALGSTAPGCTSPTLPLPPPTAPAITVGTAPNTFHLKSDRGAIANALIVVVNRNPTLPPDQRVDGTIADATGSWELDVVGVRGDFVDISQESADGKSPTTTVELR